jgi:hypothetical protein
MSVSITKSFGDYYIEVGRGNVPGAREILVTGYNPDLDTADGSRLIWRPKSDYNFLTSAQTLYIVSSSASDTGITISVSYLDGSWDAQSTTGVLNGQTPVSLGVSGLRVNDCIVVGTTSVIGDVYVLSTNDVTAGVPNNSDDIVSFIGAGVNRCNQALYSVAAGRTAHYLGGIGDVGRKNDAEICLCFQNLALLNGFPGIPRLTASRLGVYQSWVPLDSVKTEIREGSDFFLEASTLNNNSVVSGRFRLLEFGN